MKSNGDFGSTVICKMTKSSWKPNLQVPTYFVAPRGRRGLFSSLSDAIAFAEPYSRIEIASGKYFENIVIGKPLEICTEKGDEAPEIYSHGVTVRINCAEAYIDGLCIKTGEAKNPIAALVIESGSPEIVHCELDSVEVVGKATPRLEDNHIANGKVNGVHVMDWAAGLYKGNTIENHEWFAILVESSGGPKFQHNKISLGRRGQVQIQAGKSAETEAEGIAAEKTAEQIAEVSKPPIFEYNRITDEVPKHMHTEPQRPKKVEDMPVRKEREHVNLLPQQSSGQHRRGNDVMMDLERDQDNATQSDKDSAQRWGTRAAVEVCQNANPTFLKNMVVSSINNGLWIHGEKTHGTYENNTIQSNKGWGVVIEDGSDPILRENSISENGIGGVKVRNGARGQVYSNLLIDNRGPQVQVTEGCKDFTFYQNKLRSGNKLGVLVKEGGQGKFVENEFRECSKVAFRVESGGCPEVTRNEFLLNNYGLYVKDGGMGNFSHNNFTNHRGYCIVVQSCGDPFIQHCVITNSQAGINVSKGGKGRFVYNRIKDNRGVQIDVADYSKPLFEGNWITDGKTDGVRFRDKARGVMRYNHFNNNTHSHLIISSCADPLIEKNVFEKCVRDGILIEKEGLGCLTSNFIEQCYGDGISVWAKSFPSIRNNVLRNNNGAGLRIGAGADGVFEKNKIYANGMANVVVSGDGLSCALFAGVGGEGVVSLGAEAPDRDFVTEALQRQPSMSFEKDASASFHPHHQQPGGENKTEKHGRLLPPKHAASKKVLQSEPVEKEVLRAHPMMQHFNAITGQKSLMPSALLRTNTMALNDGNKPLTAEPTMMQSANGAMLHDHEMTMRMLALPDSDPFKKMYLANKEKEVPRLPCIRKNWITGSHGVGVLATAHGCGSIIENYFKDNSGAAISVTSSSFLLAVGNLIDGGQIGIKVADEGQCHAYLNRVHNTTKMAMCFERGAKPFIAWNTIANCYEGMCCNGGGGLCYQNIFVNNEECAISSSHYNRSKIGFNVIRQSKKAGIRIGPKSRGTFINNYVLDNDETGVLIDGEDIGCFFDFNVVLNSRGSGVLVKSGSPKITNSLFMNNAANMEITGAMSAPHFQLNYLSCGYVGALFSNRSKGKLEKNFIGHNDRGVVLQGQCLPTLRDCLIYNNSEAGVFASFQGAAEISESEFFKNHVNVVSCLGGSPYLFRCLLHAAFDANAVFCEGGKGHLYNCVLLSCATSIVEDRDNDKKRLEKQRFKVKEFEETYHGLHQRHSCFRRSTLTASAFSTGVGGGGTSISLPSNGGPLKYRRKTKPQNRSTVIKLVTTSPLMNNKRESDQEEVEIKMTMPSLWENVYGHIQVDAREREKFLQEKSLSSFKFSDGMMGVSPGFATDPAAASPFSDPFNSEGDVKSEESNSEEEGEEVLLPPEPAKRKSAYLYHTTHHEHRTFTCCGVRLDGFSTNPTIEGCIIREHKEVPTLVGSHSATFTQKMMEETSFALQDVLSQRLAFIQLHGHGVEETGLSVVCQKDGRQQLSEAAANAEREQLEESNNVKSQSSTPKNATTKLQGDKGKQLSRKSVAVSDAASTKGRKSVKIFPEAEESSKSKQQGGDQKLDTSKCLAPSLSPEALSLNLWQSALPPVPDVVLAHPECSGFGVAVQNGAKGEIKSTKIISNAHGAQLSSGGNATISNCYIHMQYGHGVLIDEGGKGKIIKNVFRQNRLNQITVRGSDSNPEIASNIIEEAENIGISFNLGAKGIIRDNKIYHLRSFGILCQEGANPKVVYNEIYECRTNIGIKKHGQGEFEHNRIYNATLNNVFVEGEKASPIFFENTICGCKSRGVEISDEASPTFEGNEIFLNRNCGFSITSKADPILAENKIYDNHGPGVIVNSAARGCYKRNMFTGNYESGLIARSSAVPEVIGNVFYDGLGEGISVLGAEGTYSYNRCKNNKQNGILVSFFSSKPLICFNEVEGNELAGVCINTEARGTIRENLITNNKRCGILVESNSHPHIISNWLPQNFIAGVWVTGGAAPVIEGNLISKTVNGSAVIVQNSLPTLTKNTLAYSSQAGILFRQGGRGSISENFIVGNREAGVEIEDKAVPSLQRNAICDGGRYGLHVKEGGAGFIQQCTFFGSLHAGVFVEEDGSPQLEGCFIHEIKPGTGIIDAGSATYSYCLIIGCTTGVEFCGEAASELCDSEIKDCFTGVSASGGSGKLTSCGVSNISKVGINTCRQANIFVNKSRVCHSGTGCLLEGGGEISNTEIYNNRDDVIILGGNTVMDRCTIYDARNNGVWVKDGDPTIQASFIFDNQVTGVFVDGGAPTLDDNRIFAKNDGAYIIGSAAPSNPKMLKNLVRNTVSPPFDKGTPTDRASAYNQQIKESDRSGPGFKKAEKQMGVVVHTAVNSCFTFIQELASILPAEFKELVLNKTVDFPDVSMGEEEEQDLGEGLFNQNEEEIKIVVNMSITEGEQTKIPSSPMRRGVNSGGGTPTDRQTPKTLTSPVTAGLKSPPQSLQSSQQVLSGTFEAQLSESEEDRSDPFVIVRYAHGYSMFCGPPELSEDGRRIIPDEYEMLSHASKTASGPGIDITATSGKVTNSISTSSSSSSQQTFTSPLSFIFQHQMPNHQASVITATSATAAMVQAKTAYISNTTSSLQANSGNETRAQRQLRLRCRYISFLEPQEKFGAGDDQEEVPPHMGMNKVRERSDGGTGHPPLPSRRQSTSAKAGVQQSSTGARKSVVSIVPKPPAPTVEKTTGRRTPVQHDPGSTPTMEGEHPKEMTPKQHPIFAQLAERVEALIQQTANPKQSASSTLDPGFGTRALSMEMGESFGMASFEVSAATGGGSALPLTPTVATALTKLTAKKPTTGLSVESSGGQARRKSRVSK